MTGKKREKKKKKEERRRKKTNLCMLVLFALPCHLVHLVGSVKEAVVAVRDDFAHVPSGRCTSGCTHVIIWEMCNPCQRTSQESFYTDSHLRVISAPHTALHIHNKVASRRSAGRE